MDLKDAQTQRGLLGTILFVGLGYAFYQYLYTPKKEQISELRIQAERLEGYNATAKRAAQTDRVASLEQEGVGYARRLQAFEELIPTTEQVPQLLERVATTALESDVDLLGFTPLPAEPGTFYTEQFYEVEVRGGYHEIGNFLTRIATLPRIIKPSITDLMAEQVPEPARARVQDASTPPAPPRTVVHAKLQLSTYVLPGGEAAVVGADSVTGPRPPAAGTAGTAGTAGFGAVSSAPAVPTPTLTAAPPPLTAPPGAAVRPPSMAERISPGVAPGLESTRAPTAAAPQPPTSDTGAPSQPPAAATTGVSAGGEGSGAAPPPVPGLGLVGAASPTSGAATGEARTSPVQPPASGTGQAAGAGAPPPAAGQVAPPEDVRAAPGNPARPGDLPPLGTVQ